MSFNSLTCFQGVKHFSVKGQDDAIHLFRQMLLTNKPRHFLFYGPPGTGKTSTIKDVQDCDHQVQNIRHPCLAQ